MNKYSFILTTPKQEISAFINGIGQPPTPQISKFPPITNDIHFMWILSVEYLRRFENRDQDLTKNPLLSIFPDGSGVTEGVHRHTSYQNN